MIICWLLAGRGWLLAGRGRKRLLELQKQSTSAGREPVARNEVVGIAPLSGV
jgi:hypothetical protein